MDQLICASLSHTHYWYEVGMLKVLAEYSTIVVVLYDNECHRIIPQYTVSYSVVHKNIMII